MYPSLSEALGEEITPDLSADHLWSVADRLGLEIPRDRGFGHGKLIEELWEHMVGDKLGRRRSFATFPWRPRHLRGSIAALTESPRSGIYTCGSFELATGYSELIDPVIQRERFQAQALAAAAGDDEAM